MKATRITFITAAVLHAASANAQIFDQQYVAAVGSAANIDNEGPIGQSFTPTLSTLDFFRLNLEDNSQNEDGATFQLRTHSGSGFGGPVLGTSASLFLPDGWGFESSVLVFGGAVAEFTFSSPVALTPGAPHTAELVKIGGDTFFIFGRSPGDYSGGAAFSSTLPPTADFYFQEGSTVPEVRLSIARVGSASAQITWPTNSTGYVLDSATNLPAVVWSTVTNEVTTAGDRRSVTVDTDATQRVYRLRKT